MVGVCAPFFSTSAAVLNQHKPSDARGQRDGVNPRRHFVFLLAAVSHTPRSGFVRPRVDPGAPPGKHHATNCNAWGRAGDGNAMFGIRERGTIPGGIFKGRGEEQNPFVMTAPR